MAVNLPLPDKISQSSQSMTKFRVLSAQFGNGYEQTKPDGINNKVQEWSITWEALIESEKTTVINALNSAGASEILLWTPPGGSASKFRMTTDGYSISYRAGEVYNISCNLKQVF